MGGGSLLDFYDNKLKTVPDILDMKKLNIPAKGDCCPISLIASMLAEGILAKNPEIQKKVVKFLKGIFKSGSAVPKNVGEFLDQYEYIESPEDIKTFFNNLEETVKGREIKAMSDQLRLAALEYLRIFPENSPENLILIEALAYTEGQRLGDPLAFSQAISYTPLLASNGIGIDSFDPHSIQKGTNLYLKGGMNRIEPSEEVLTLNVYFSGGNHYETLIKKDSILSMGQKNNPADDSSSVDTFDTYTGDTYTGSDLYEEEPTYGMPSVSLGSQKNYDNNLLTYDDFKSYLLNNYNAEIEPSQKYSVEEIDNNIHIFLNKEKIVTVAQNYKHKNNIKLNIMPGKEEDGAFVALSSFKGFLEVNGHDLQKYNAHFTGYDTLEKAKGFLESLYDVFSENDVLDCKLMITFDPESERNIRQLLMDSRHHDFQESSEGFKWLSLRDHFGIMELKDQEDLDAIENNEQEYTVHPIEDPFKDDEVDSLRTESSLSYGELDDDGISVDISGQSDIRVATRTDTKKKSEPRPHKVGRFFTSIKNTLGFGPPKIGIQETESERLDTLNTSMDMVEAQAAAKMRQQLMQEIRAKGKDKSPKIP